MYCSNIFRTGLLGEDDETDLGSLEKKLAEQSQHSRGTSAAATSTPTSPSQTASAQGGIASSPHSVAPSPSVTKEKSKKDKPERRKSFTPANGLEEGGEEVEALSEMMCSLVTNQSGETRYLG